MELSRVIVFEVPVPIGAIANGILFKAKLNNLLASGATQVTLRLSQAEAQTLVRDEASIAAGMQLLNQPGFPQYLGIRNTPESLWNVQTKSEQAGLIIAAAAINHNQQLHELYCQGALQWKSVNLLLDCVVVTLSWSSNVNAKLVKID